jgi:FKBP-type peptidyl-prolyl cis-trans isomerase FklB
MKAVCITLGLVLMTFVSLYAQKKPGAKSTGKPVARTAETKPVLKNIIDSASYGIGLSEAKFLQQQGIKKINAAMVAKAIDDVMNNRATSLDESQSNHALITYMNKIQAKKSKGAIEEGEKFLQENKKRPEVKSTASGLQYEVIKKGSGTMPQLQDSVVCNYSGKLINGTVFDDSYSRGEPITFRLDQVIKGWTEALQLMPIGSKYKLYIPYELAYGIRDNGPIPGGSMLIFEVELLDIKGKQK